MLKKSRYAVFGAVLLGLSAGCTSFSGGGVLERDRNATYKVENRPDGFMILSKSRFSPPAESETVRSTCIKSLMATAHDYAHSFGRQIQPLEEQRIRVSLNRNGNTGITNCEASVSVVWAR